MNSRLVNWLPWSVLNTSGVPWFRASPSASAQRSPTKVYEREFKRMQVHPNEIGWRLSFDLLLRRELELSREDVRQKFWFGLRIADPDHASPVYQEMRQQTQSSGLAQPITLRPQIGI